MPRADLNDLLAFLAVARERSFTRAAAQLGVSQSALSQTVRGLEARLGLRLLSRTTRSVAPTEAGERLLRSVGPRFEEIDAELAALSELREKPSGTVRITTGGHACDAPWPAPRPTGRRRGRAGVAPRQPRALGRAGRGPSRPARLRPVRPARRARPAERG